jgi:chromosome segregation ATPase
MPMMGPVGQQYEERIATLSRAIVLATEEAQRWERRARDLEIAWQGLRDQISANEELHIEKDERIRDYAEQIGRLENVITTERALSSRYMRQLDQSREDLAATTRLMDAAHTKIAEMEAELAEQGEVSATPWVLVNNLRIQVRQLLEYGVAHESTLFQFKQVTVDERNGREFVSPRLMMRRLLTDGSEIAEPERS